ncbi:universal stress protein [Marinospirillum perlucidum]|uniref:universal stress protein n=1 Tax=Marinospirillum perlucidum TaxID=1982602 RepID=UPI000DF1FA9E|nr:universal stress protein [Marinospirillum perlucidum]
MSEYKTLLLATDFSEGSKNAVDQAIRLAKMSGARLHLLHIITELADKRRRRIPADVIDVFIREINQHAEEDMETFKQKYFAPAIAEGLEITTEILVGSGYQDILEAAEKIPADMIIMGVHSRSGLERALVGSMAERVVSHSSIPVLTVRD